MKRVIIPVIAVFALAGVLMASAFAENVNSLRGDATLEETKAAEDINQVLEGTRFPQNYRQQPPLIPHKVDKYQINLKVNQCMRCHNWQYAAKEGAPKISETHYMDTRTGKPMDDVVPGRWFCTQCHVPQVDAKPLVENTFSK